MRRWDTVAIIGVGLIGGSIGLALRKRRLAKQVIGIGRRKSSLAKALTCGCVTKTTTSVSRGVADAELIVVCTPVEQIAEHVSAAAAHCSVRWERRSGAVKSVVSRTVCTSVPNAAPVGSADIGDASDIGAGDGASAIAGPGSAGSSTMPGSSASLDTSPASG